jgi:transposase-like protein
MSNTLIEEYSNRLEKLMPLAKKAYGSRSNTSPAHDASRQYTNLLKEYYGKGGSLVAMASELGVAYAGLRRRVVTSEMPSLPPRKRSRLTPEETEQAILRIKDAKSKSTEDYHTQLAAEYDNGISLAKVASGLGLSSSQPLYYGVQRSRSRV